MRSPFKRRRPAPRQTSDRELLARAYDNDPLILEIHGPLVAATVLSLESAVTAALNDIDKPVVIDLTAVTEYDSTGIALLAGAHAAAIEAGGLLWLVHSHPLTDSMLREPLRSVGCAG